MTRLLGLIYARKQDEQVNKAGWLSHCLRAVVPRLVTWSDIATLSGWKLTGLPYISRSGGSLRKLQRSKNWQTSKMALEATS